MIVKGHSSKSEREKVYGVKSRRNQAPTPQVSRPNGVTWGFVNSPSHDLWQHLCSFVKQGSSLKPLVRVSHEGMQCSSGLGFSKSAHLFFPYWITLALLSKISWPYVYVFTCELSILFHWVQFIHLHQYQSVIITTAS